MKMTMRLAFATLVTGGFALPSHAQDVATGPTKFFEWACVKAPAAGLRDVVFGTEKARINNISLKEDKEFITDAPTLKLSASAANRTEQKVSASLEVVGMANQAPVFAVTARPVFGFIRPQENEELAAFIMAPRGTLAKVDTVCVRASAYAARN